jgi:hypothetical protein
MRGGFVGQLLSVQILLMLWASQAWSAPLILPLGSEPPAKYMAAVSTQAGPDACVRKEHFQASFATVAGDLSTAASASEALCNVQGASAQSSISSGNCR